MENKGYPGGFTVENQSPSQPRLASGGQIQPPEAPPYNPQPFPQNQVHQFPHQQPVYGPQNNAYRVYAPKCGPNPLTLECSNCHSQITTDIDKTTSELAWLSCGAMCFIG